MTYQRYVPRLAISGLRHGNPAGIIEHIPNRVNCVIVDCSTEGVGDLPLVPMLSAQDTLVLMRYNQMLNHAAIDSLLNCRIRQYSTRLRVKGQDM
jgi:hypothetical protein